MKTSSMLEQNEIQAPPVVHTPVPDTPRPERPRSRWWVYVFVLGALAFAGYRIYEGLQQSKATTAERMSKMNGPRAVPVITAPVARGDMPEYLRGLGSVTAFNTVTVKTRVDGQLVQVAFREGQFVRKGDLLAVVDPRPFQVAVEQAEGQLARDRALLKDAQVNLERNRALYDAKVIAKQQLDTQAATVGQYEGTIEADQAQVANARLNLSYTRVLAPLSGRIGLRQVDPGNMIHAADANGLAVITQVQPIAVLFTIPQDELPRVLKALAQQRTLPVEAYDRSNENLLDKGTLLTVDNQIDQTTGTSRLKAVFNNRTAGLFPNQFVNVRMLVETLRNAVVIPASAIQRGPNGTFVYLVKPDQSVTVRPVTTGIFEGQRVSIDKGLMPGDVVVVDGTDKLTEGSKIAQREQAGRAGRGETDGERSGRQ